MINTKIWKVFLKIFKIKISTYLSIFGIHHTIFILNKITTPLIYIGRITSILLSKISLGQCME